MAGDTTLEIIVGGNTYQLDDVDNYLWLGQQGFGMAPVSRKTVRGPQQDGESDVGFVLDPRVLAIDLAAFGSSYEDYYSKRDALLRRFVPQEDPIKVRVTLPDESKRQIDCHYIGELDYPSRDKLGWAQRTAVALRATDPTFYDPATKTRVFRVAESDGLVFPITFSIHFVSSIISEGDTIGYGGSWRSYPTIILRGPLENPIVNNLTTGHKLELVHNIASGETVTIELTPGNKSVEDQDGNNLIGTLSADSDLADFHLAAPQDGSSSRDNVIQISAGGAIAGTSEIEMRWLERYVGI